MHWLFLVVALLSTSAAAAESPALTRPELADEVAPESFRVRFETTAGDFVVRVNRAWAPRGADRFYNLVAIGFYDDTALFRVVDGFVAQWGIPARPDVALVWRRAKFPDDPVLRPNRRGYVSFASGGPNTRTTQVFVNLSNNRSLDAQGFAPIGRVTRGWATIKALYAAYGEGAPLGSGPDQRRINAEGNAYLRNNYPRLDWIERAVLIE